MSVPLPLPNIIEFALDERYLGINLYPRQATMLKLAFCSPELLTGFDHAVLAEWMDGFSLTERPDGTQAYTGRYGTTPDLLERIDTNRNLGRNRFREVIMVAGRRGSKGVMGAVGTCFVLWELFAKGDPAAFFGMARSKQLHVLVFAGQQHQARVNQWRDLADMIRNSACFGPYIADLTTDTMWLYSPSQVGQGIKPRDAAIVISARESTTNAGRGMASIVQLYDEMAHMDRGSTNRPADEIYGSASPGVAQFGHHAWLYQASSPWHQLGKFYAQYRRALELEPGTGQALDPDMVTFQFPSHELYRDWEKTNDPSFRAWPGGPSFPPLQGAIFDSADADKFRRADPHGFDVEFGAQWATTEDAYLPAEDIDALFAGYNGQELHHRSTGTNSHSYIAHADPSRSGANFALVVAHSEQDGDGDRHVVVDLIKVWRPRDFPDHRIDYTQIHAYFRDLLTRFRIRRLSFDQYNSAGLLDDLKAYSRDDTRVLGRPQIYEQTATAPYNQRVAETLKAALARRLVHAPRHDLAEDELRFLQERNGRVDHPTSGPVKTSDAVDCLAAVVDDLLGDASGHSQREALSRVNLRAMPGRPDSVASPFDDWTGGGRDSSPRGRRGDRRPERHRGGR